ncbi:MAG: hypothetical protein HUN04_09425 [Desulfobacter sp.]|nr:MAG: hypothetical protein HUN04_09425 [Desulfobacter sp.]
MKPTPNKMATISTAIILFLISIPVAYAYYFTDWRNDSLFQADARGEVIPEFQEDSRIFDERILLRKDKSITVNNSRLVFKGVTDNKIRLDLYLLELDPEYAYPHYISKADLRKTFRLGDSKFQLLKISKGSVQLKIIDLYQS